MTFVPFQFMFWHKHCQTQYSWIQSIFKSVSCPKHPMRTVMLPVCDCFDLAWRLTALSWSFKCSHRHWSRLFLLLLLILWRCSWFFSLCHVQDLPLDRHHDFVNTVSLAGDRFLVACPQRSCVLKTVSHTMCAVVVCSFHQCWKSSDPWKFQVPFRHFKNRHL